MMKKSSHDDPSQKVNSTIEKHTREHMATFAQITLSEFQLLLRGVTLPSETTVIVTFEDEQAAIAIVQRQKALDAMRKLRGSGNGKLVTALLHERERERER
jgi:hypothetical protein